VRSGDGAGPLSARIAFGVASLLLCEAAAGAAAEGRPDDPGVFLLLLVLPVAVLCFSAVELILWVLAPGPLAATGRTIAHSRGRCLVTGLVTAVASLLLIIVLREYRGVGEIVAALILGVVALLGVTGITAVTALLGQGALELADRAGSRALAVAVGSALLGFSVVVPIVGWTLCAYFVLVGMGGVLQALAPLGLGRSGAQAFRRSGVQENPKAQGPRPKAQGPAQ
jgi:hypothetical protein